MDQPDHDPLLSSALLAEVEGIAALERRSLRDVVEEAVERFVRDRRLPNPARSRAQDAAKRILGSRQRHRLPEGETIRSMMTYGRM